MSMQPTYGLFTYVLYFRLSVGAVGSGHSSESERARFSTVEINKNHITHGDLARCKGDCIFVFGRPTHPLAHPPMFGNESACHYTICLTANDFTAYSSLLVNPTQDIIVVINIRRTGNVHCRRFILVVRFTRTDLVTGNCHIAILVKAERLTTLASFEGNLNFLFSRFRR